MSPERNVSVKGRPLRIKSMRRFVLVYVPVDDKELPYVLHRSDSLTQLSEAQDNDRRFKGRRTAIYDMKEKAFVRDHELPK